MSSVYGGYDQPVAQPAQDIDCDWVLVTDRECDVPPWRTVVEPRPQLHPRLAAKVAKCRPDLYADADADVYVWIDGNLQIETADFASWAVASLAGTDLAQHRNLERDAITTEAATAAPMAKYAECAVREQAQHYVANGHPDNWGVWWTGVMVRTAACLNFGDAWLVEQVRWTYEDQVSLPPVLHRLGLRPTNIPITWTSGMRFTLRGHRDQS